MNKLMGMMTWLSWYKGKMDLYLYTLYHQPMWQKKIKVFFVKPQLKLFYGIVHQTPSSVRSSMMAAFFQTTPDIRQVGIFIQQIC